MSEYEAMKAEIKKLQDALTARQQAGDELAAAGQAVMDELNIIRERDPRPALIVHIDTHNELHAALNKWRTGA